MLTDAHKRALAALDASEALTGALKVLKQKFLDDIYHSEAHETKKREDLYNKCHLVDSLRAVIKDAVNKSI